MLVLKDTSISATASTQATFSVWRPRAIPTSRRLGAGEKGRKEPLVEGCWERLRDLERNTLQVDWRLRFPDGKGQERKECRL